MGWFGSESRFSSDNSTGTRCLAKAANSSAGNCDRIVLRGLVEFTGVEMWPVGTAAPLREDYCLWPQRPLPTLCGAFGCDYLSRYDGWATYVCVVPHIRRLKSEFSATGSFPVRPLKRGQWLTSRLPLKYCDGYRRFRMTSGPSRPDSRHTAGSQHAVQRQSQAGKCP